MQMQKLLSVAEVVARIGLRERTIRAAIADGRLRVVRPAGFRRVLVEESEVERLVAGHEREPRQECVP